MADRKIVSGVTHGGKVYGPGEEPALNKVLHSSQVDYLKRKGVITGDWDGKGDAPTPHASHLRRAGVQAKPEELPKAGQGLAAATATATAPPQSTPAGVSVGPGGVPSGAANGGGGDEDLDSLSVNELKSRAEGLNVTRADGKDGSPLKSDYIAALKGGGVSSEPTAGGEVTRASANPSEEGGAKGSEGGEGAAKGGGAEGGKE